MKSFIKTLLTLCLLFPFAMNGQNSSPLSLPDNAPRLKGYAHSDSIHKRLDTKRLLPLEGVWEMTANGATIAIERVENFTRQRSSLYNIVIIDSPDRSIAPGTLMGKAIDSSDPAMFDALLYTDSSDKGLSKAQNFSLHINKDGRLSLKRYKQGVWINLWKLVPYMWRRSFGKYDQRPEELDGMIRVYPTTIKQFSIHL